MLDDERFLIERIDGKEVKRANRKAKNDCLSCGGTLKNDLKILQESLKTLQVVEEEFAEGASEMQGKSIEIKLASTCSSWLHAWKLIL